MIERHNRIGSGDSLAAGLIYGLVTGRTAEASLRFAVAASALKHSMPGDSNRVTVAEVDRLVAARAATADLRTCGVPSATTS